MSDVSRYRRIFANEWHDPAFRRLNAEARVVRLYVSAGPQTTSVGCFRLSTAMAVEDLGGTSEAFEDSLTTVCDAMGWAWDPLARVIWITDWFTLNPPQSPNVVTSWAKLLRNVPDCDVKDEAISSIENSLKHLPAGFREPWKELSKLLRVSESKAETNQGTGNREQGSGKRGAGFRAERKNAFIHQQASISPTSQIATLARKTISFAGHHQSINELADAFYEINRNAEEEYPRARVIEALTLALEERRQPA